MKYVNWILIITTLLLISCTSSFEDELESSNFSDNLLVALEQANDSDLILIDSDKNIVNASGLSTFMFMMNVNDDELCRGSGISFARCVQREVDGGNCVTISKDGDDYVATKAECPELEID